MTASFRLRGRRVDASVEEQPDAIRVRIGERTVVVDAYRIDDRYVTIETEGRVVRMLYDRAGSHVHVALAGESYELVAGPDEADDARDAGAFVSEITSPMPGKVLTVEVAVGEEVETGQPLLLLEAMKMEQTLRAPSRARVAEIRVDSGAMVGHGAVLVVLAEPEDEPQA